MSYPVSAARGRSAAAAAAAWSPTDLASLVAWYDFSDATTLFTDAGTTPVSADADLIYQANDKSGNTLHVTQGTAGSRPTYKVAIQNGLSVARFDGGDALNSASGPLSRFVGSDVITAFGVFKLANTSAIFSGEFPDASNDIGVTFEIGSRVFVQFGTGAPFYALGDPDANWRTYSILLSYDGHSFRKDGVPFSYPLEGWTTVDETGTGILSLFPNGTADVGELIFCKADLSIADHNALGAYLADKWGLTWTDIT